MKISDLPQETKDFGLAWNLENLYVDIDQDIYGVVDKVPKVSAVGINQSGQQVVQTNNSGVWSSVPSNGIIGSGVYSANTVVATTSGVVSNPNIPLKITRPRYNIFEKPVFNDGEVVEVDLTFYGIMKDRDEKTGDWLQNIVETVCLGQVEIDNNFRLYILDFGDYLFKPNYPFKVMGVPSQAIIQQEFLNWDKEVK